jgi:serine/threonine protein kinase
VLQLGEIIERKYQVLRRHGEGGMGIVFEGQSIDTGQRVAIKVMRSHLTAERDLVLRFEREAAAAASVDSAHVVGLIDSGDLPNGHRYMVMEFLEGESLYSRLKTRRWLAPEETAAIGVQLLDGLSRVHAAGIIHRDLKPHNVFLVPSARAADFVKIFDFGACKMVSPKGPAAIPELKTSAGNLFGTVPYMAPECFEDGSHGLDARADIYSTGIIMYRCVTGTLPFKANTVFEMLIHLREGRAIKLGEAMPGIDSAFAAIVDRATALKPQSRFQSADVFRNALLTWMENTSRLAELLEFLEESARPGRDLKPETAPTLTPVGAVVPSRMRDLAPTLHAEEEVAAIAATTAEQTNRLDRMPAARKKLPTIEEIPIDVETPSERPPKRDVHDDGNTVEMRTILKRGK